MIINLFANHPREVNGSIYMDSDIFIYILHEEQNKNQILPEEICEP
jgi:hypothetical protein